MEHELECPKCNHLHKMDVDLTTLPTKEIPEGVVMKTPNEFEFTLPQSNRTVTFKLLTHGDEKKIQYAKEAQKKTATKDSVDRELTTRLKHIILSVDGDYDKTAVNHFVDNELFAMDSRALRTYIKEVSPDQKFEMDFECQQCGHEEEALAFIIDTNFFWPKS